LSDQQIVLAGVGLYLVGMLVIGIFAARRVGSAAEFVVAGRRLPLWLCTSTLVATWMSAGTVMGAAGAAYEDGFLGVIAVPFAAALVLVLIGLFFARMLRRLRLLTVVGFFKSRYGDTAGMLAAVAISVSHVAWAGAQLVAFGYILHALVGVSTTAGVLVATVIVLVYTTAGGMWAVAVTDFAQVLILTAGLVLLLPIVISDLGGVGVVMAALPEGSFRIIPRQHDLGSWLNYARAWAIVALGSLSSQSILQRTFSSRDESVSQNSAYLAAIGYLTVGMIPVFLGMVGAIALPGLVDPEFVVPELAMRHLHPVAMAIFAGALLSAIMSSADSALLAPASIVAADIVPFFFPRVSDRTRLMTARLAVPVFGFTALAIALYVRTIYSLMLDAASITLVCLAAPFIAGIWWSKANRFGTLAGMIAGVTTWLASSMLFPTLPADLFGLLASALGLLIATPLTQGVDPPWPLRDVDGNVVPLRDRLGILSPFARAARS
jgi:SSS family transporter